MLDCLYLRNMSTQQNGHELLDLRTGQIITRGKVTIVPIMQNIIDIVEDLASKDGMPEGLKIELKSGGNIYDTSWVPGVDYDESTEVLENNVEYNEYEEYDETDENQDSLVNGEMENHHGEVNILPDDEYEDESDDKDLPEIFAITNNRGTTTSLSNYL